MRTLLIATGNPLRRDDGVAHAVVERLQEVESRALLQLTPEVAADIADYDTVVFIDADVLAPRITMEPLDQPSSPSALTHHCGPAAVVAFSRDLFGFKGRAFICRIPAADFSAGEGLAPGAAELASQAADRIKALLRV